MSDVRIYYNGSDLFYGIGPPPFVALDTENVYQNNATYTVDKITLAGRLQRGTCGFSFVGGSTGGTGGTGGTGSTGSWVQTAGLNGFEELHTKAQTLATRLSKNFKSLYITERDGSILTADNTIITVDSTLYTVDEDSVLIYNWDHAIVRSITFDDNVWYNWVPYTIEIDCYKYGYFGSDGIIDPSREVSLENLPDGTANISISCACKGLNKTEGGFVNAKQFCYANSELLPSDLSNLFWNDFRLYPDLNSDIPVQISEEETLNRLTGEVSVRRSYLIQKAAVGGSQGILKYTRELNSSETGEITVVINGTHQGALNIDSSLQGIRDDIVAKNWYSIAQELNSEIYPNPINFSLERNVSTNSVQFTIEFSSKINLEVYAIDETRIDINHETSMKCIEVSLTIKSDLKNQANRWSKVLNYYNSLNFNDFVQSKWVKYGYSDRLNYNTKDNSYSENQFDGVISISARFCLSQGVDCGCLQDLAYTYDFTPPLKEYKVSIPVDGQGCHYIEDLLVYKRASFSVRGSVLSSTCCSYEKTVLELKNRINQISNSLFSGTDKTLDSIQITKNDPGGVINFSFSWSAKVTPYIPTNLLL